MQLTRNVNDNWAKVTDNISNANWKSYKTMMILLLGSTWKNTVMLKLRYNLRAISVMPHFCKSYTTELAKNTNSYKIRVQSVVRIVYQSSAWILYRIVVIRAAYDDVHTYTHTYTHTHHAFAVVDRCLYIVRFAAGRRGKIVPFGRLFERFATSLFELSISWQISAFPCSYFISLLLRPFAFFFYPF